MKGKGKQAVSAKTHTNRFSLEIEGPSEELPGGEGTSNEIMGRTSAPSPQLWLNHGQDLSLCVVREMPW